MKRHGYLFDKIVAFSNLEIAAQKAFRGKIGKSPVARFHFNMENEILDLQGQLKSKNYKPMPLRFFTIYEPKVRRIGASDFRDRVVHHAIFYIIEPLFERGYIFHSYACRKLKGIHRAVRQAQKYCRRYIYFLKCDIRKYFESIDHCLLKEMLERKFKDKNLLWLLNTIIDEANDCVKGIPIGNLTSQHFANFFLDKLDHFVKDVLRVKGYLRYMDDFLLFSDSKEELHCLKARISDFLSERLNLRLNERISVILPCSSGIPFLGFNIFPGLIRIRNENKRRMIRKYLRRNLEYRMGIIGEEKYIQSLTSMTEHLKTGNTYRMREELFEAMYF